MSAIDIAIQSQAYLPAIFSLMLLCLVALVQSFLCAPLAFVSEEQVPGIPVRGGHGDLSFRVVRTYQNTVENLPALGIAAVLAILLGVSPVLTNWLVALHLIARLAFWAAYYNGSGKIAGGPRTLCYIGGLVTNFLLVLACVWKLMF